MKRDAPITETATYFIVTQVKSNRVVYFTDDPAYSPPMEGDWNYVSSHAGELPKGMTLGNCWRWRFNGGVFTDTAPKEPRAAQGEPLVEHNRKALAQILNEKIDLVRAQHAPSAIMGALVREQKLREAQDFLAEKPGPYPLLEAVAVARNIALAQAAQLVTQRAAATHAALAETERVREQLSRAIMAAQTGEELLALREQLLDKVYPELSERFALKLDKTEPLDPQRPLGETHLRHEQVRLQVQLREKINARRAAQLSQYTLDDVIFRHKGALAERVLANRGAAPQDGDFSVLENHARARGIPLAQAASDVLKELGETGRVLAETEKLKDSTLAEIAKVRTPADVQRVSALLERM